MGLIQLQDELRLYCNDFIYSFYEDCEDEKYIIIKCTNKSRALGNVT